MASKEKAAQSEPEKEVLPVDLVLVVKDGEEIAVHKTCVKDHQRLGWKVKAE